MKITSSDAEYQRIMGKGFQAAKIYSLFTYSIFIWNNALITRGTGGNICFWDFCGNNFPWGGGAGSFHMMNFQEKFFTHCFFIANSILGVVMLRVIAQGKFSPRLTCLKNKFLGKRNSSKEE